MEKGSILVVGGAGYIGSHVVKDLLAEGYDVFVLDDLSLGHKDLVPEGAIFTIGDLGDASVLDGIFSQHPIDAAMHFAAYALVGESVQDPLKYYHNNVARTVELLKSMVRHRVNYFIFSSSAAVYGEPVDIPIMEDHPCHPINPYGGSKRAVEQILDYCDQAYGLKSVSFRYFNAAGADESGKIGERHDPETHLIPLVLQVALGKREHIEIYGTDYPTEDGTCIRDYIHVSDLGRAHILALELLRGGLRSAIYNLGNSKGYSVKEVIDIAEKVTGCSIKRVESDRRPGDPAVLIAGSERARKELGWAPSYEDIEDIIRTAWIWHRNDAEKKSQSHAKPQRPRR